MLFVGVAPSFRGEGRVMMDHRDGRSPAVSLGHIPCKGCHVWYVSQAAGTEGGEEAKVGA